MIYVVATFAFVAGYVALHAILRGWVLSIIWGWFMVPIGAPALGIAACIGVSLVTHMLCGTHDYRDKTESEKKQAAVGAFLVPLLVLGMAWVVKQFMG